MALQLVPRCGLALLALNLLDVLSALSALILAPVLGRVTFVHLGFLTGCKISGPAALDRRVYVLSEI